MNNVRDLGDMPLHTCERAGVCSQAVSSELEPAVFQRGTKSIATKPECATCAGSKRGVRQRWSGSLSSFLRVNENTYLLHS